MEANTTTFIEEIKSEFPTFTTVSKGDSKFMQAVGKFLWLLSFGQNTAFMEHFTTTIGYTTYTPVGWETWNEQSRVAVLRHERVHLRQARAYGVIWFSFLYLFAYLPIGLAFWRTKFEKEAYTETLRAYRDYGFPLDDMRKQQIIKYFTGPSYGWMCPFHKSMSDWYDATVAQVLSEK